MDNGGNWQYNPTEAQAPVVAAGEGITWTASEFIAHQKSHGWYGLLAIAAIGAAFLVWLVTKDIVSAIVIVVAAAMFGTFATRKPRELAYRLDDHGLTIGQKHYPLAMFRSFAVMAEGAITSVVFTPLKRFAPLTTVYYHPNDEDKIVGLLAAHLPMEERKQDPIERLMWRIRF